VSSLALDASVIATTFIVIFPVELPDKTLVATLVLSTRYRALPVWIGVSLAFAVQCFVAVAFGGLLSLLPHAAVLFFAGALFAVGAVVLLRTADAAVEDAAAEEAEIEAETPLQASTGRAVVTSFLVLFAAEWGDLSQLVTAGLAARYDEPLSVFIGALAALCTVAALAVLVGRQLAQRLPLALLRRIAAVLFTILAVVTLVEAVRSLH
jgi:putative Ca2+/H+ antiporter (TMEM165/GDT1 family)